METHNYLSFTRRCVCPICGKVFFADYGMWAYKLRMRGTRGPKPLCSWHCMREMERRKKEKKYNARSSRHKTKESL